MRLTGLRSLDYESRRALRGTMTVNRVYGGKPIIVKEPNELRLIFNHESRLKL